VAEVASELAECREVLAEELSFELALDPGAGVPAVLVAGSIDRQNDLERACRRLDANRLAESGLGNQAVGRTEQRDARRT